MTHTSNLLSLSHDITPRAAVPARLAMASILATVGAIATIIIFWLYRVNCGFKSIPPEVVRASPRRWTKDEIRETYERLKRKPLDFLKETPPRLERRYVVVGGSGKRLSLAHIDSFNDPSHEYMLTTPRPRGW